MPPMVAPEGGLPRTVALSSAMFTVAFIVVTVIMIFAAGAIMSVAVGYLLAYINVPVQIELFGQVELSPPFGVGQLRITFAATPGTPEQVQGKYLGFRSKVLVQVGDNSNQL